MKQHDLFEGRKGKHSIFQDRKETTLPDSKSQLINMAYFKVARKQHCLFHTKMISNNILRTLLSVFFKY